MFHIDLSNLVERIAYEDIEFVFVEKDILLWSRLIELWLQPKITVPLWFICVNCRTCILLF